MYSIGRQMNLSYWHRRLQMPVDDCRALSQTDAVRIRVKGGEGGASSEHEVHISSLGILSAHSSVGKGKGTFAPCPEEH